MGYIFTYKGTAYDLEKVNKLVNNGYDGSNVVRREFFYDCKLIIYLTNKNLKPYLRKPRRHLRIGRQQDLANVKEIKEVELEKRDNVEINNTMVPFSGTEKGEVLALPSDYTNEINRDPIKPLPYCIIKEPQNLSGYYDPELDTGVYIHEFN